MAIVKPSTAFPTSADWTAATVLSYMKDQTPLAVDLVTDVQGGDFEQTRLLWVKEKGAFYRLNLASVALDNGDTVLRDNVGRRYEKQLLVRERLAANRTYYVRTDGSDSNTGLANTSGGAFLTVQKAIDVALSLDMSIYAVTISIGAGAFAQNLTINGSGNARITLSGAGYSSTTVGAGSGTAILINYGASVTIQNLKVADGASVSIWVRFGAVAFLGGSVALGSATARQIGVDLGGYLEAGSATIYLAGNAPVFLFAADYGAMTLTSAATIITTAARTYSTAVVRATTGKITLGGSITWNVAGGSISGTRYDASVNGVISVNGGTIPGTVAGTTATGGQYV